ncbi:MAG: serine/threonine-protein kinase [Gemmatimonadota bacterium]
MSVARWEQVAELFADVLELPHDEREAFLMARTTGDPALGADVRRLLAADAAAGPAFPAPLDDRVLRAAAQNVDAVPERVGPWRLLEEIGRGGMGRVFLAERVDGHFEQRAAVKLLKRGMDTDAIVERFRRERQILAALEHPNIARLLDGGVADDGRPFLVMPFVDGTPVTAFADAQRLSIEARLALFRTICFAVEHAHRNLIVHRDLKPSNILVTTDGRPMLLDFGIAKLLTADGDGVDAPTEAGLRMLTPEYAAPEQFGGGPITTSTDVYGLGAVLYELLCGERPRTNGMAPDAEPPTLTAVAERASAAIATSRGTDPTRLRRRLDGDLETIVATALRTEPARRYASVGALREDLERHTMQLPVLARPDSTGYRVSRFVRRHRAAAIAGATIVGLVLAFAITAGVQASRIRRQAVALAVERDRAQREAAAAEQVSNYLVGVFELADPTRSGLGDSITARELLARGAERAELDLAGQPSLAARMIGVIAQAYYNLGQRAGAERLVTRARALHRGDPHADPAGAVPLLRQLMRTQLARGATTDAVAAIEEGISIQSRIDPAGEQMVLLLADRADAQHAAGNRTTTLAAVDSALALADRLTTDAAQSRTVLRRLASVLSYTDDSLRTERVYARSLAAEALADGPRSVGVASTLVGWGKARQKLKDLRGADSLLRLALDIQHEREPRSLREASMLTDVATVAVSQGRFRVADSLVRIVIDIQRERLGEEHRTVASSYATLAAVLQRSGRAAEAIPYFERSIAYHQRTGDDPKYVPVAEWRMAEALREAGRTREALAAFRRSLAGHEAQFAPEYILTANVRRDFGRLLQQQGRAAEAEPMLRRAVEVLAKRWGDGDARVDQARLPLGRALLALGRRNEATTMLAGVHERLTRTRKPDDPVLRDARAALDELQRARAR